MRDPHELRCALAELLDSRARLGESDDGLEGPPRLRLQDWQLIEELSIDSRDYVVLRRVRRGDTRPGSLTERERDVVRYACGGLSNMEIAYRMGISSSTVRVLLSRASRKIGAGDRQELVRRAKAGSV